MVGPKPKALDIRFWPNVGIPDDTTACWPWLGHRDRRGYGRIGVGSRTDGSKRAEFAHRVSFFLTRGHWPANARHSCDNPTCVNPFHILDGSHRENMRDAIQRGQWVPYNRTKTHCKHGHPLIGGNLGHDKQGYRVCRICARLRQRAYRYRERLPVSVAQVESGEAKKMVGQWLGEKA